VKVKLCRRNSLKLMDIGSNSRLKMTSVETQSNRGEAPTCSAEPQRLKTLANLQCAIANTVKPCLLQYRAVHHDGERAAETQSACRCRARSSTSAARGTIKVRSRHTCGCDEPTSSVRVTFTSARRRLHRPSPSALPTLQPRTCMSHSTSRMSRVSPNQNRRR
jgi:hypothetical protein